MSHNGIVIKLKSGTNRTRTYDPLLVRQMLSQLSYDPKYSKNKATRMGIEPTTSAVTGRRSNQLSHRALFIKDIPSKQHTRIFLHLLHFSLLWLKPRPISNSQLHALRHFHLCPIYLVVFKGVYFFRMGYLILRGASRLDAFSVYPFRAWLLGRRLGSLTDAPAARPSRSSRTKDSSSQISYAHAG